MAKPISTNPTNLCHLDSGDPTIPLLSHVVVIDVTTSISESTNSSIFVSVARECPLKTSRTPFYGLDSQLSCRLIATTSLLLSKNNTRDTIFITTSATTCSHDKS